jgi:hypothetical protein
MAAGGERLPGQKHAPQCNAMQLGKKIPCNAAYEAAMQGSEFDTCQISGL